MGKSCYDDDIGDLMSDPKKKLLRIVVYVDLGRYREYKAMEKRIF